MYILSLTTVVEKLFRSILFIIDNAIYHVIPELYNTILAIARTSPLSQANIADMAGRIYKLLAVFMIFKVTFSLIMYIVNPDDFSDKSKGISKLITNIVISLALLVLTPYFFSYAYQLQKIVLEDNSLATVVFGDDHNNTKTVFNEAGNQIAYTVASTFISPNLSAFDCSTLYTISNGKTVLNANCFGFTDVTEYANDGACQTKTSNSGDFATTKTLCGAVRDGSISNALTKDDLQNYAAGVQFGSVDLLFRQKLVTSFVSTADNEQTSNNSDNNQTSNAEESEIFAFDYRIVISTAAGVVILLFLITICMDVGLRSIKLAFLQLIAPIPILSYIDPKSGKDGMFKKWYQMCLKTFLSLFIRLLALYFAIYIISRIHNLVDIIDGSYVTSKVVTTFIVIGALMFAKDFVKILEGLGIKLDGGFILNPIKKFNEQALGGKAITGAIGGALGGLVGGGPVAGKGMITGRLMSFGTGALKGATTNKGFKGGLSAQADVNRKIRDARINGASFWRSRTAGIASTFGLDDAMLERRAARIEALKDVIDIRRKNVDSDNKKLENSKKAYERLIKPKESVINAQKTVHGKISEMEDLASGLIDSGKAGAYSARWRTLVGYAKTASNLSTSQVLTHDVKDAAGNVVFAAGTVLNSAISNEISRRSGLTGNDRINPADVKTREAKFLTEDITYLDKNDVIHHAGEELTAEMMGEIENLANKYKGKEGKEAVVDELMKTAKNTKSVSGIGEDDVNQFKTKQDSYATSVELANKVIEDYNKGNLSENGKPPTDTVAEIAVGKSYKATDRSGVHNQKGDLEMIMNSEEDSISGTRANIARLEERMQANVADAKVIFRGQEMSLEEAERILKDEQERLEKAKSANKVNRDNAAAQNFTGGN